MTPKLLIHAAELLEKVAQDYSWPRDDMLATAKALRENDDADEISRLQDLVIRQGDMLSKIVNAIRGEPPEDVSWSTHDAVELVTLIVDRLVVESGTARTPLVLSARQIRQLSDSTGGDEGYFAIARDGDGIITWVDEYPEEGSVELTDEGPLCLWTREPDAPVVLPEFKWATEAEWRASLTQDEKFAFNEDGAGFPRRLDIWNAARVLADRKARGMV